ncbi:uncharacterized protein LOC121653996 [Melanotaenia boesemani]|uniref:uncharacterized protein LOC121653996 n=1 Tax=Melanotaenia boesemani TaxID=1250792 RepID=UPI001C05CE46|nr:uncharacterized protein LOC121653996 [Melanotaenia boesemani]
MFQDYTTGFHNYNNRVILTLQLCSFLTNLLKSHTAIGRFLKAMELQLNTTIHHNTIRKAFFHYSALTAYDYNFSCLRCGHNPAILISDANWKVSFDLPVSLLKRPVSEDVAGVDLTVNIRQKWDRLEREILASGICEDLKAQNPFWEKLDHSNFTPWIGAHSRIGDIVPKTELLKGLTHNVTVGSKSKEDQGMNEDELLRLVESKRPSKADLVKACSDLGVSSAGTEADLINRLQEMLLYKDVYPKMFVKLQKTGETVLHVLNPEIKFKQEEAPKPQGVGFSMSLFHIQEDLKPKLVEVYQGPETDYACIQTAGRRLSHH